MRGLFVGVLAAVLAKSEAFSLPDLKAPDCVIYLDSSSSWPQHPPIITDPIYGYIYPEGTYANDDRSITVIDGDAINLSCVGRGFDDSALSGDELLQATCVAGQFAVTPTGGSEMLFGFNDLGCTGQPIEESSEPGLLCGPNQEGFAIQYGFQTLGGFTAIYEVCFNQSVAKTYYSRHVLYKNIIGRDTGNDRPSFKPDGYYDFDVDEMYSQDQQTDTISGLTGINSYVDTGNDVFLSRGHFSPNADFVYYAHQDSTFYFVNVAPQWQCFNGGNWVGVENSERAYAENNQVDLIMYTGTHGILELDDNNGNPVKIYLNPDGPDELPVPLYYWKVIKDPVANTGVAIIGLNNPHLASSDIDSVKLCPTQPNNSMMDQVSSPDDIHRGVTYACYVQDAAAVFEEMQDIPDIDSLGYLE